MKRVGTSRIILLALAVAGLFASASEAAYAAVPNQFIAKMYSEALGRAPDPGGWAAYVSYFQSSGCARATLTAAGRGFYTSGEYASLGYDHVEQVLTLYRGILSREPDAGGFQYWVGFLDTGGSLLQAVEAFFASTEFGGLVAGICGGGAYPFRAAAITLPLAGGGFGGGDGAALQALIDRAAPGSTVYLAPRSVTSLNAMLVVRAGVTVATTGLPDRARYARMGRLVRNAGFDGEAVRLEPGARLVSVWVSGQRQVVGQNPSWPNVVLHSGTGGALRSCRLDTPAGWTNFQALGRRETGRTCAGVTVAQNLITGYNAGHTGPTQPWSDGLSIACEGTSVTDNHIIDPTDVGIVIFRADPAVQASQVTGNTIVSAGLSAYGALVFDPLTGGVSPSFAGALIGGNQFWTGTTTHFDIGLSVGTRAWFHNVGAVDGYGATMRGNTTAGIRTRMDAGIAVDGMLAATVTGNDLLRTAVEVSACPTLNVGADVAGGHASGTLQPYVQAAFHSCIGH